MKKHAAAPFAFALTVAIGCGGEAPANQPTGNAPTAAGAATPAAALTPIELEQGIGPIRDLALGEVDASLAETGAAAFVLKCSACHKLGERYVGPDLGEILSRRRPEFVMNMMLNANEMVQRHPEIRELLAQFYTPMPTQVTDRDEARAILEYLRSAQTVTP